jgi:indole-3-glycerol phosphate synthase
MTILDTIADERRAAVKQAEASIPLRELEDIAAGRTHHSLAENLQSFSGSCVIAEIKKASPSAGVIKEDFCPTDIATSYMESGARGISILTEPNHFQGSQEHLADVRKITELPILRKDFIVAPYQVIETAAWGADVMLLIVAMTDPVLLKELYDTGMDLGLEILVESHNHRELEVAMGLQNAILGVNNRNLKTFDVSLDTSRSLAAEIGSDRMSVAESGISSQSEIQELAELGYNGFLIGEALLRGKFNLQK